MSDRKDSDQAAATPAEGVRILGAEEAQAAVAGSGDDPGRATGNAAPDAGIDLTDEPAGADRRNVGFPEEGPSWSATDAGEVPPLPHWTEAPTGAVPAIFADDSAEHTAVDEDLDAWATISGSQPRFRAENSDWAEADFATELSGEHDNNERLGALDEEPPGDEEAEFAEALAARRRPSRSPAAPSPYPRRRPPPTLPTAPRRPHQPRRPAAVPAGARATRRPVLARRATSRPPS